MTVTYGPETSATYRCPHNKRADDYCFDCDTDRLARDVARILSEHGLQVSSPDEGDLDDVERERWDACIAIVKALRG